MPRIPFASAVVLVALTTACATPSADAARRIRPPAAYAAASLAAAAPSPWPQQGWWRAYGDPQLDALVEEALKGSPDVAAAEARLHRAQALAGQARAALQPSVTASASAGLNRQSYNNGIPPQFVPRGYNDVGRASLDFGYELDFWGRNRNAVAAAASEARAVAADAAAARLMLSTAVASAYARLQQLFAERDLALSAVTLRREGLDLVQQRVSGGLDTRGDARAAEARLPAAQGDLAAIDETIALTRDQLAALTGAGPDRGLVIAPPKALAAKAFGLPASLPADLIGRKPEIAAARWRVEAAARRIGVARAQFYPDINLAALIGRQSLGLDNLLKATSEIGQVGPALSLPLFDGGRRKSNLRGAEADYALAVAQYDGAVVHALQDVADAAASARALQDRLGAAGSALAAQEDAYRIARLRYRGGLSTAQSVLTVEDDVLKRRRAVVDLQGRAFILDVALVRALGGGFDDAR